MTVVRTFRRRLLDLLIVLAVAFWFPQFWLAEKIIRHRSRSRGGDDENIKGTKTVLMDDLSPPFLSRPSLSKFVGWIKEIEEVR